MKKFYYLFLTLIMMVFFNLDASFALIPVEGLLYGPVNEDEQYDPVLSFFSNIRPEAEMIKRSKLMKIFFLKQEKITNSCQFIKELDYASLWNEKQAQRSMIAHLQWVVLDKTIKEIAYSSKSLQKDKTEYKNWAEQFIDKSCSPNVSVYGLKMLKNNFEYYFDHEDKFQTINTSINKLTEKFQSKSYFEKNLFWASKVFRAFCSWGGNPDELRMLPHYLQDPLIITWLAQDLSGSRFTWNEDNNNWDERDLDKEQRVSCDGVICRARTKLIFDKTFVRPLGSIGIKEDVAYAYCKDWRFRDLNTKDAHPLIRTWVKAQTEDDSKMEISWLRSQLLGIPNFWGTVDSFDELSELLKTFYRNQVATWAQNSLQKHQGFLFYEESLEIIPFKIKEDVFYVNDKLAMNFILSLGQMDQLFGLNDKIKFQVDLTFSENTLAWIRKTKFEINKEMNEEKNEKFEARIKSMVEVQLNKFEGRLPLKQVSSELSEMISIQLVGKLTNSVDNFNIKGIDSMKKIPVRLYFGLNALQYLSTKSKEE